MRSHYRLAVLLALAGRALAAETAVPTDLLKVSDPNLEVTVWASTPMLKNPTNLDFDGTGHIVSPTDGQIFVEVSDASGPQSFSAISPSQSEWFSRTWSGLSSVAVPAWIASRWQPAAPASATRKR